MSAEAQQTVQFADHAGQQAKRDAGLAWLATALYAAFAVAAVAIPNGMGQGKFLWIVAAPIVAFGAGLWAYSDGRQRGVETSRLTLVTIPFGLLTLAFGLGALGFAYHVPHSQYAPPLLMAVGYAAFGRSQRNSLMEAAGIVVLVITTGLVVFGAEGEMPQAVLGLGYVGLLLIARLSWRLSIRNRS